MVHTRFFTSTKSKGGATTIVVAAADVAADIAAAVAVVAVVVSVVLSDSMLNSSMLPILVTPMLVLPLSYCSFSNWTARVIRKKEKRYISLG